CREAWRTTCRLCRRRARPEGTARSYVFVRRHFFFFKQKTAYEIGLGIPAEPLFRSCSVTMMLFLHLEVKPLMTLTTVLYLSCALISGHLAMMLMELTKRR